MQNHLESDSQTPHQYTHVATFLPLKADFPKKHFWTISIWNDRYSMRQFVMTEPHVTAMKKFEVWAGHGSAFADWTSSSNSIDWEEAMRRLQNPTFHYRKKQQ
jgi:hypothetical protein